MLTEYFLEDIIQMLGFVPPIKEKKRKRDVDVDLDEEVRLSLVASSFFIFVSLPYTTRVHLRICIVKPPCSGHI